MEYYFFFKIHYSLTFFMVGIIWLIQIIHYPLFKLVGENTFNDYHKSHIQRTSLIIAIPMILEVLTGLYLLIFSEIYRNDPVFLLACALAIIIWGCTFFISVPKHKILSREYNTTAITALIATNWIRTIAWSLRAILLFFLLT